MSSRPRRTTGSPPRSPARRPSTGPWPGAPRASFQVALVGPDEGDPAPGGSDRAAAGEPAEVGGRRLEALGVHRPPVPRVGDRAATPMHLGERPPTQSSAAPGGRSGPAIGGTRGRRRPRGSPPNSARSASTVSSSSATPLARWARTGCRTPRARGSIPCRRCRARGWHGRRSSRRRRPPAWRASRPARSVRARDEGADRGGRDGAPATAAGSRTPRARGDAPAHRGGKR